MPQKEYGYRNGQLLIMASNGDDQRIDRFITNFYYAALGRAPAAAELNVRHAALEWNRTIGVRPAILRFSVSAAAVLLNDLGRQLTAVCVVPDLPSSRVVPAT